MVQIDQYCLDKTQLELKLVKRLLQLSRTSWSPTLRANAESIAALQRELEAATRYRQKSRECSGNF
jgi:hypothetical protein